MDSRPLSSRLFDQIPVAANRPAKRRRPLEERPGSSSFVRRKTNTGRRKDSAADHALLLSPFSPLSASQQPAWLQQQPRRHQSLLPLTNMQLPPTSLYEQITEVIERLDHLQDAFGQEETFTRMLSAQCGSSPGSTDPPRRLSCLDEVPTILREIGLYLEELKALVE